MIGKDIAPAGYINEDAVSRIAEKVKRAAEIVDPTAPNAGTLTHTDTLPDLKRLLDQAGGYAGGVGMGWGSGYGGRGGWLNLSCVVEGSGYGVGKWVCGRNG